MKVNESISQLKLNIKAKERPNSLLEIAKEIQWLKDNFGNAEKIGAEIGISAGMVNTFLSSLKVEPEVQKMISARKIDSVFSVHALKSFSRDDQLDIAEQIAANTFSSQQARALVPLRNIFPNEPIERLMEVIRLTKNNKQYVNHFPMPDEKGLEKIRMRIANASSPEPFSLENIENIGVFKISKQGVKKMREDAKSKGLGFHNYLLALFDPNSDFEKGMGKMMS